MPVIRKPPSLCQVHPNQFFFSEVLVISAVTQIVRRFALVLSSLQSLIESIKMSLDSRIVVNVYGRNISIAVVCINQPFLSPLRPEALNVPTAQDGLDNFG